MSKLSVWFQKIFPLSHKLRKEADEMTKEVQQLKTLALNGDTEWFIRECKKHKDEVCNGDAQ